MSKEDALKAYRDSLYDGVLLEAEARIGSRSMPFGGLVSGIQMFGNALVRPFKVGGAYMFGYDGSEREFPSLPNLPQEFKATGLESAFTESWKLKRETVDASVKAMDKLLSFDIGGWWKEASVARFAEAKDHHVVFADEVADRQAAANAGSAYSFVDALTRSGDSGGINR